MPPRRATRNTRAKGPTTLSPEDQQVSSKRRSETLLQYWLSNSREIADDILKVDCIVVSFFKETYHIRFTPLFDEILEIS